MHKAHPDGPNDFPSVSPNKRAWMYTPKHTAQQLAFD
jgi:hypothetical protein